VAPGSGADGTNDGVVDVGDYLMWIKWMSHFGPGGGSWTPPADDHASVPEPNVLMLTIFAAMGLWFVRRTR
jgi:hypothetical protein